jgi:signal transduction histidine kinase/ActR/RegA family two-component response regulator
MSILSQPALAIRRLCITGAVVSLTLSAATLLTGGAPIALVPAILCVVLALVCLELLRRDQVVLAADLLCATIWFGAILGSALGDGLYSVQILGLIIFLVLSGLFRGAAVLPSASLLVLVSIAALGMVSEPPTAQQNLLGAGLGSIGVGVGTGIALWLTMKRLAVVHSAIDEIGESLRAQEVSLAEQRALLEALGKGIPGGIGIVMRDTAQILWCSKSWSGECTSLIELFPEQADVILRSLADGIAPEPLQRADRWIQLGLSPTKNTEHVVVVLLDVTEEHRSRLALREQTLALSRADRLAAVGRMAEGLCHEVHNTLTTLSHLSWLVSQKLPPDSELLEELAEIDGAVRRASGITRPLLPLAESVTPEREVVELGRLLADTRRLLDRLLGGGIWLHINIEPGPHTVEVSPGLMEEVLINLATNSREAMKGSGRLEILLSQSAGQVWLEITDTGVGMDAETLRQCREMFFTTRSSGSGLGLAMVDRIVRRAGGRLDLRSTPGVGTTVLISLPAVQRVAEAPPVPLPVGTSSERCRVMVLDDSEEIRRMVCAVLTRAGFEAVEVCSAQEAIEEAEARPVDLLISDVIMPDMSGAQLARILRERYPKLPVLLITGYAAEALKRARLSDAILLKKPFAPGDLIDAVERTLRPDPTTSTRPNLVVLSSRDS